MTQKSGKTSGLATLALAVAAAALAFAIQFIAKPAASCTPGPWFVTAPAPPAGGANR